MNRCRFSIPNDIWKWNLKPQGFAILVYLHYLHVHCKNFIAPSADEIASQLHMSKDMAAKQIAELNRRGLLDQHMVPMLESNGKNFFSLPNELFFLNIGHGAITVYAYLLYCEDRRTHQCHPSYRTISDAVHLTVKAKLFCPEIAGLFCRIAGLFCHDSRANLSLKPVCFGIAIS